VPRPSERPVFDDEGPFLASRRAHRSEDAEALKPHDAAPEPRGPGLHVYGPRRAGGRSADSGAARRLGQPGSASRVLADRMAAALVHHEPGWRLPRHSALARRYNVSTAEIDAAMTELAARHLIRRLPDGQLYRVSPVEYLIPLEGVPGLGSRIDLMGGELTCRSRQTSWRRVREEIGCALGVDPAEPICVVRAVWDANGEPAAYATTYLTSGPEVPDPPWGELAATGKPAALQVEMQLPPPSVARSLRLSPVQPAAMVTVRFDDLATSRPVALTIAVLRPEKFRIAVQSAELPLPAAREGSLSGAWTHAVQDWEP